MNWKRLRCSSRSCSLGRADKNLIATLGAGLGLGLKLRVGMDTNDVENLFYNCCVDRLS